MNFYYTGERGIFQSHLFLRITLEFNFFHNNILQLFIVVFFMILFKFQSIKYFHKL